MTRYVKAVQPVLVNFDPETLSKLDQYKSSARTRRKMIHEAVELYVAQLEKEGVIKSVWSAQVR